MSLRRVTPSAADLALDPKAEVYACGDVTSSRKARNYMAEQKQLRDRFRKELKAHLPKGARLKSDEAFIDTFCFVVAFDGMEETNARYVAALKQKFPFAIHLRRGRDDVWQVPYEKKARQGLVKCIDAAYMLLLLCVLVGLGVYLYELWQDI